ncbi:cadherin-23-like [Littorina saxatilis]|uniref:cadherin-23-like n=1 Tax=Littorina saxatilis TaxID=31220 RepID=UPI0038B49B4D
MTALNLSSLSLLLLGLAYAAKGTIDTDVNSNAPVFDRSGYVVELAEHAPIGVEIVRVVAHDPDEGINGVVSYHLYRWDNEMFTLNSRTGSLFSNIVIDREVFSQLNLTILAVDGGDQPMTGTTSVVVMITDVNDNAPELVTSEFSITEGNAPRRYVGMLVARDRDMGINGEVEFSMTIVSPRLPFHVSPNGQIRTASYSAIDREIQDTYILEILMKDKGTPSLTSTASVTVHVSDVNDNAPELVTSGASIPDVNDNASELVTSEFSITEGNAPGRYVGMLVARDRDVGINGEVEFSMTIVSPRLPFTVSPDGQIRTASYSFIDREMQDTYVLEILMKDNETPSLTSTASVTVHVSDVNDNAPMFMWSEYVVELVENAPIGEEIVRVVAHDPDEGFNGQVSYHLHPWNGEMFTLNSRTGSLFSDIVVDREIVSQVNLIIHAVDGGDQPMTGTTSVVVMITDVNDNAPELMISEFSITEGNAPRRYVGMLVARDRDVGINGEVEFSMTIVSPRLPFHVSPDGQIRTASYSAIDRDIQDTYILEIVMKDKGTPSLTSTASVTVHVMDVNDNDNTPELVTSGASITDVNDNSPELVTSEFRITEGNAPGRYVGILVAFDRHLGINGEVPVEFSMTIVSPWLPFTVSPDGQIRTASYSAIDREMQDTYILEVLMKVKGTPSLTSTASVTVNVMDVNDNAPVFMKSEYVYHVAENMQIGEEFARVVAHDPDEGINGVVSYHLHPSDNEMFTLNSRTGWLTFNMEVDREAVSQVNLIIHAVDGGDQPMTGTTSMVVMITDVNDNAPELVTSEFSITEGNAPRRYVGMLVARDRDVGINGEVEFSMTIVSPRLPFHVSPDGQIRTASYSAIDRDIQDTYILEIVMKDKGTPSLTSTASVTVHVSDGR